MTRIIRPVGPRAKRLRAADEDGAAKGHVRHFEFASPNRLWRTRRKSALFPHCSRIATFFVSSLDAALRLLVLRHARKKIFVSTIPTRRTLSVTNVTSLVFIFFMSDIPLIVFFAGLRNWRSGGTATRCRCSPRKYYSGRTCILVDPRSVRKRGQYAVSVRKRAHHPRPARVDGRSQIALEADIQPAGDWAASDSFLTP